MIHVEPSLRHPKKVPSIAFVPQENRSSAFTMLELANTLGVDLEIGLAKGTSKGGFLSRFPYVKHHQTILKGSHYIKQKDLERSIRLHSQIHSFIKYGSSIFPCPKKSLQTYVTTFLIELDMADTREWCEIIYYSRSCSWYSSVPVW